MTTSPEPANQYRRALWITGAAQLMAAGSTYMLSLLPRLLDHQGVDLAWRGAIMAMYTFAYLFGTLTSGRVARRIGGRSMAVLGCLVAVAGCAVYIVGSHWVPAYFVGRALHGLGSAFLILSLQGWLLDAAHVENRGRAMGLANSPGFLMMAVSPAISEAMSRLGPSISIFLLAAVMCALLLPLAWSVTVSYGNTDPDEPIRNDRMTPTEWGIALFLLLQGFAFSYALVMVPLVTDAARDWSFSLFFAGYGITGFVVRSFVQKPLVRWVPHRVQVALGCLVAGGTVLLASAALPVVFAVLGIMFGFGHALFFPSLIQLATRHAAQENLLHRFGKLTAATMTGAMLGESASGITAAAWGVRHACAYTGAVVLMLQIAVLGALYCSMRVVRRSRALHEEAVALAATSRL